jgi:multisubunit Na+/H+ antiporter MnhB subunit
MAFIKDPAKTRFAAWMIAVILIARWGVIFGSTLPNKANGFSGILVDLVVILVYVGIIIAGTRQNRTQETAA